jgi:DNA-directed RNA polymerase subunit RPC12/RpoP
MEECLSLVNVEATAAEYGVSPGAVYYWFNKKVKSRMSEILVNDLPGPKAETQSDPNGAVPEVKTERPAVCPECGGHRIWKNGTYTIINWVWLLTVGWLVGLQQILIQRWRCANCGRELVSPERQRQAEARQAWWQQVRRLIGLSRFKLGLSVRKTQLLIAFEYGRTVSVGFIQRQTQSIGQRAQAVLERLSRCRQKVARFLLFDETFPKLGKRAYRLGVVICEYGLIRSVRTLRRKAQDIPAQLKAVVGSHYQPQFFLTDLDVTYGKYKERAGLRLQHLRDIVHLMRQIIRLFDEAVREVTLDVPKGLPHKARKKQRALKQRLLRKQLRPVLAVALKAFAPGYESVCVLMLEGVVSQLRDPQLVLQTASVQRLATRLERFAKKHNSAINTLLELAVTEGTPKTTNALESKNGIFKPFSRLAKSFLLATGQAFFAGVTLMENFDVKQRGIHQDTSAIQRAGINLNDLGATDFFSAVGLERPQISLAVLTE